MNTPKPCLNCKHLYADCMYEDDPSYDAECKIGLPMGVLSCKKFYPDKHSKVKRYDKHGILIIESRR